MNKRVVLNAPQASLIEKLREQGKDNGTILFEAVKSPLFMGMAHIASMALNNGYEVEGVQDKKIVALANLYGKYLSERDYAVEIKYEPMLHNANGKINAMLEVGAILGIEIEKTYEIIKKTPKK